MVGIMNIVSEDLKRKAKSHEIAIENSSFCICKNERKIKMM